MESSIGPFFKGIVNNFSYEWRLFIPHLFTLDRSYLIEVIWIYFFLKDILMAPTKVDEATYIEAGDVSMISTETENMGIMCRGKKVLTWSHQNDCNHHFYISNNLLNPIQIIVITK